MVRQVLVASGQREACLKTKRLYTTSMPRVAWPSCLKVLHPLSGDSLRGGASGAAAGGGPLLQEGMQVGGMLYITRRGQRMPLSPSGGTPIVAWWVLPRR